jgi:Fe(3+) dicitrate transport protein
LQLLILVSTAAATRTVVADAGSPDGGPPAVDTASGGADGGTGDVPASASPADAGAPVEAAAPPAAQRAEEPLPPPPPPPPTAEPLPRVDPLTVVGTRETRTAGSAHILKPRDLERMDYDNPDAVMKAVPNVYSRGEDGFGLRPNIGIRGTSPDRSKKVTLMEDGILFSPAPYAAPAAYFFPLITRMEMVRVIKGPGAVSFGPQTVGGAIDLVTRGIPASEGSGGIDLATGSFGYGKLHGFYGASTARSGYVIEGVHLRSSGFKEIDGGGNSGFEKNEWMWKGRHVLSTDPNVLQSVGLKLGYADEDSRESYLGLTDADLRQNPHRRYRASRLDRMQWHRTQAVASYRGTFGRSLTVDAAVYRNGFTRTWRKVNRIGGPNRQEDIDRPPLVPLADVLANPDTGRNAVLYSVLTGAEDWSSQGDTIYIGPNHREFVSQGAQVSASWQGATGPVAHRLEAGVRYHYDRIDRLHTESGFQMRGGVLVPDDGPTLTTANGRDWVHALAFHLVDAATAGPITLTPGLRLELVESWRRDRLAGSEQRGASQRVVIPGIGAYGALTSTLGVLAGVYRGFSPAAPGQPSAVKPETSINYEAGVRFSPSRWRLEAIGFFNDYRNLTSVCTGASGCLSGQIDNQYDAGRAHIYGAELFARAEPVVTPGYVLPVTASYSYTRTELLESFTSQDPTLGNVKAGDELPFVPRHLGSVIAGIEMPRGSLMVSGTYVSPMRERAGQEGSEDEHESRTDESFILDVTVRVPVAVAGHFYLNVRNVLGAEDIAARLPFGARPVAPRWIQVGTKWSF